MTSQSIKEYGLQIGYSKIGITSVDSFSGYVDEVVSRGEEYGYFQKIITKPLEESLPQAKSVIVMVLDYYEKEFPEALTKMIGKIYLSRTYKPFAGSLANSRIQLMMDYLSSQGYNAVIGELNVPARWMAAHAGVTTFGKNTFAYADDIGSYLVIHTILLDVELEYDKPTLENKCPPNCNACINACPTKALYAPFHIDSRKCIAFNNWVTQDGRDNVSSFIPYELREAMGCKIHGCDICQDVCPRNQKKLKQLKPTDSFVEKIASDISLEKIINMTDDYFINRIHPIMYNYLQDKRYFIRNAAIAIGNSKDEAYIKDLEATLNYPDEMIREATAWALGRIGGRRSKQLLETRLPDESSDAVKKTIKRALNNVIN